MKKKEKLWWGFLTEDGQIEVLAYKNDVAIMIAEQAYFVRGIFDPFYATDIWEARKMINLRYAQELH